MNRRLLGPDISNCARQAFRLLRLSAAGLVLFLSSPATSAQGTADLVLKNGSVYTVNPAQPWAEAVAIRAGEIMAVGTDQAMKPHEGPTTKIVDLGGRFLMPGFFDSHVHALEAGINEKLCFFPDGLTLDDYEVIARECALSQAGKAWVLGAGVFRSIFGKATNCRSKS